MDSLIATEIIDEIIAACASEKYNQTNASEHSIASNYEASYCETITLCDQLEIDGSYNEELEDDESNSDDDMDLSDHFDSLESEEIMSDTRIIEEQKSEVDTSEADGPKDVTGVGAEPNGESEKVEKMMEVDSKSIALKGYSTSVFGQIRKTVNLPMMIIANQFSEYVIRCERFPIQMNENELIPIFEKFGQVYKLKKLMKQQRILVSYTNAKDAEKAIESLDRSIVQGCMVRVCKCLQNGRLVVRHIPKSATKNELFQKFASISYNLKSVSLYNDTQNENRNRGFCYLDYGDYDDALNAMKTLSTRQPFGRPLNVEWPNRRFEWETSDTMYITNLRSGVTMVDLRTIFSGYGEIMYVKVFGNFGVVKFQYVEDAVRASREVDTKRLGNENVTISFVRLTERREPKKELKTEVKAELKNESAPLLDTLYIYNLHPAFSAGDLRKMFSFYGSVIEIDKNGDFASVRFHNSEHAKYAAHNIDKRQLGVDIQISFIKPTDKTLDTLYIRNLRSGITVSDLRKYFSLHGDVTEIDKSENFASVRFRNSEHCMRAARDIDKRSLGNNVEITFVQQPEKTVEKKLPMVSDTLYVNNMYEDMTITRLKQLFSVYGEVVWVDKNGNYAAVKFRNIEHTKQAVRYINRIHLGKKNNIEISFHPKSY